MNKSLATKALAASACAIAIGVLGACDTKPPTQAGTCPSGTHLDGADCKPNGEDSTGGSGSSGSSTSAGGGGDTSGGGSGGSGGGGTPSGDKPKYDKEMVDSLLKRSAERVKANCGNATEEGGAKSGPSGETTVSVTVSHTGWIMNPTVPAPFNGTAVGNCIVNAFDKKQFPPFAGQDVIVTVPVEVVDPKKPKSK